MTLSEIQSLFETLEQVTRERSLHPYRVASLAEKTAYLRRVLSTEITPLVQTTLEELRGELALIESGQDDFLASARAHLDRILSSAFAAALKNQLDDTRLERMNQQGVEVLALHGVDSPDTLYARLTALEQVVLDEIHNGRQVGLEARSRISC